MRLVHHQHDFGRLDDCRDLITYFYAQVLHALASDDTLNKIFTYTNRHLCCDDSQNNGFYFASQLITRRYLHAGIVLTA
jgi:hypothetical protein